MKWVAVIRPCVGRDALIVQKDRGDSMEFFLSLRDVAEAMESRGAFRIEVTLITVEDEK